MIEIPLNDKRKVFYSAILGIHNFKNRNIEDSIKEFENVKIIERMQTPPSRKCYWFIFKDDLWFKQLCDTEARSLLMYEGPSFLKKKGYIEVDNPQDNDIVIYTEKTASTEEIKHYGIYMNGKVISKFGRGNIYEHPLELVPEPYGNKATFMRKKR